MDSYWQARVTLANGALMTFGFTVAPGEDALARAALLCPPGPRALSLAEIREPELRP